MPLEASDLDARLQLLKEQLADEMEKRQTKVINDLVKPLVREAIKDDRDDRALATRIKRDWGFWHVVVCVVFGTGVGVALTTWWLGYWALIRI
ncbi:MAG: hypothetical protein AAB877_00190 [Patescibacteria group bacterium]